MHEEGSLSYGGAKLQAMDRMKLAGFEACLFAMTMVESLRLHVRLQRNVRLQGRA
jgi:hypothetical protein